MAKHHMFPLFPKSALSLSLATALSGWCHPVSAQTAGMQVIHGAASTAQVDRSLTITTRNGAGTSHSVLNWQSFSVPAGTTTHFHQPSAQSMSINRVLGPDPSSIFGKLSSNGRLVLVNPAGISVGAGAVVDTTGFTASTLRMSAADALAARLLFDGGSAHLQVDGTVIGRGGDVVLIAPHIATGSAAVLQSDGATVLLAGQKAEITGRGLEGSRASDCTCEPLRTTF